MSGKVGVPVPQRGYWNKLQAGRPVKKVTLPARDLVTVNRIEMSGELPPKLRARLPGDPGKDDANESIEVRRSGCESASGPSPCRAISRACIRLSHHS
jgi:hypothetical protein